MADSLVLGISTDFLTAWNFWIGVGILAGIYGIFTLGLQLNVGFTGDASTSARRASWRSAPTRP